MADLQTSIPLSDANDLDDVIRALGIEDSDTTPAEAVAELKAEIERLRCVAHPATLTCEVRVNGQVVVTTSVDALGQSMARSIGMDPIVLAVQRMAEIIEARGVKNV